MMRDIAGNTTRWPLLMAIGWQPIKRVLAAKNFEDLVVDSISYGGAGVYGFRGSEVAAEVERRFGSGPLGIGRQIDQGVVELQRSLLPDSKLSLKIAALR